MDEHPKAAAEYAGVSRSTIGRWMDDGLTFYLAELKQLSAFIPERH